MKIFRPSLIIAMILSLPTLANARDTVVVLSPFQEPAQAQRQARMVLQNLVQLDLGDNAILIDGYHLKTIGVFNIPQNKSYSSAKARLRVNAKAVGALMKFSKQLGGGKKKSAPFIDGALRLPQLLRHLAQNNARVEKLDVIILGSPFYDDPSEPAFSMADGQFPSDAHLIASRSRTPFGTADHFSFFSNLRVHFCYGSEEVMRSDKHKFFVERFWTLFIEHQGGVLSSFAADCSSMFQRLRSPIKPQKHNYRVNPLAPFGMIRLSQDILSNSIYVRPLSIAPLPTDHIQQAQQVEIGLSWDCVSCDLDLYAQSAPGMPPIYFGNKETAQGSHRKDFRSSPLSDQAYETITFQELVDLQKLKLVINFYEGEASEGVKGELRLAVGDLTYATNFKMKAQRGNKGRGVNEAFQSGKINEHILLIDPLQITSER